MQMSRSIRLVALAGLAASVLVPSLGLSSSAFADVAVPGSNAALDNVKAQFPGVTSLDHSGRVLAIYGGAMTQGATDGEAVTQFLAEHGQAFGAGALDLEISRVNTLSGRNKTVYVFNQLMDGLPVEFGRVRVVTHNGVNAENAGNVSTVVLASARLAQRPEGGFAADAFTASEAMQKAMSLPKFATLDDWSDAELVVFFGEGDFSEWITPIRAWKFTGNKTNQDGDPQKYTFFVDAATNEMVHARTEILHINITGQVQGFVSPNNTADHSGNLPAVRGIGEVLVRVQGQPGTTVKADRNGNFTIPWSGTTPVVVEASTNTAPFGADTVATGQVQVNENGGSPDTYSATATPGTPVTITMNPAAGRTEVTTAEVNALHYVTVTRNYFADLAPSFAATMDTIQGVAGQAILPANVQVAGTCNAFYNGISTNYYPAGGGCNNTAFASVINHEYGHHIVNRLGLGQGAFGEGFSDTISILINDDPVIGRFFLNDGGAVRLPDTAGTLYPCTSAIHTCGQVIGDFVIELRRALGTRYGSAQGLAVARVLHADWAQITGGGLGSDSAHPQTVIEFLMADDDDTAFCNGTPNYDQIRSAALLKNLPVPGIEGRLSVAPLASNPTTATPGQALIVGATVSNGSATLTPGSARVLYRHSTSNSFFSAPMTLSSPGTYQASIPSGNCGQRIEYTFVFGSSAGNVTLPNACTGGTVYTIDIPVVISNFLTDTFEAGVGAWTNASTATSGQWTLGDPIATAAQPGAGTVGTNCWFTGQGTQGGALGEADVDGGAVTLTSPTFSLTGRSGVIVRYDRWFSNGTGGGPYEDPFRIEVSSNNGTTWLAGETVGPANSLDTNPGWRPGQVNLDALGVPSTSQFRIRFIAQDTGTPSLVEAAIDNLQLGEAACECNDIDFNNDGSLFDPLDIDDFLSVYSEGPCSTSNCDSIDFNNDLSTFDPQDVDAFLSVFSEGPCIR